MEQMAEITSPLANTASEILRSQGQLEKSAYIDCDLVRC